MNYSYLFRASFVVSILSLSFVSSKIAFGLPFTGDLEGIWTGSGQDVFEYPGQSPEVEFCSLIQMKVEMNDNKIEISSASRICGEDSDVKYLPEAKLNKVGNEWINDPPLGSDSAWRVIEFSPTEGLVLFRSDGNYDDEIQLRPGQSNQLNYIWVMTEAGSPGKSVVKGLLQVIE